MKVFSYRTFFYTLVLFFALWDDYGDGLIMMVTILIATVVRKSVETVSAMFRSFFLLISRFVFPKYGEMSSDVVSRIMAVTASHRLMSQKDSGKSIVLFLYDLVAGFYNVAVFGALDVCYSYGFACCLGYGYGDGAADWAHD